AATLTIGEFLLALLHHWRVTNAEDSRTTLAHVLDMCITKMESGYGQYGRGSMAASAEIHSARAPLDRSLKEAVLFKVMLGKCKTMEDALEESGVSRHAAMTVHQDHLACYLRRLSIEFEGAQYFQAGKRFMG
ncbi:TPR and ankyrin repeat-containing protein 1, partial [Durusdinium trenchii]